MASSLWVFLPVLLLVAIIVVVGYCMRKGVKNEALGPQGQSPYGVHGWLALYIGATYYLAPLYTLGSLGSDLSRAEAANPMLVTLAGWTNYKAGSWLLVLAAIAMQWRGAWLLNNRWKPSSVSFAKIVSLTVPILVVVGDAILGAITLDVTDAETTVKGIFTGLIRGLIWAAYFQFSKRVRNTYYPVKINEPVSRNDLPQCSEPDARTPSVSAAPTAAIPAVASQPLARRPDQSEQLIGTTPQIAIEDALSPLKPQADLVPVQPAVLMVDDDALWAAALAELEEGRRHAATWARSFSAADGDEAKAKAAYLRERVHQMYEEATAAKQAAEEEQRAVILEAENRVAAAKKKFVEGGRITEDEIVSLVNASDEDYSLTRLTDRIRGNTLLHLCARLGLHEEALTLLRNGSDRDAGNGNGQKPFEMVAPDSPLALALRTA